MANSSNVSSAGRIFESDRVTFTLFSSEEVRKLSVVKVVTPVTFNVLNHAVPGGLYDPAMGPILENSDPCKTCMKNIFGCPGHFGHIDLPVPVVNPFFHKPVALLMKISCPTCRRLQIQPALKWQLVAQLRLAQVGFVTEALEVDRLCTIEELEDANTLDRLYREKVVSYVQDILRNKHLTEFSDSKAAEAIRNSVLTTVTRYPTVDKKCIYCKAKLSKFVFVRNRLSAKVEVAPKHAQNENPNSSVNLDASNSHESTKGALPGESSTQASTKGGLLNLNAIEIRDHLRKVWKEEKDFISEVWPVLQRDEVEHPTDLFFIDVIPVPPPNVRPVNKSQGMVREAPQNSLYKSILSDALILRRVLEMIQKNSEIEMTPGDRLLVESATGSTPLEKLHHAWESLQLRVDCLLDSTRGNNNSKSAALVQGLKQLLEKKQGVIRQHMMGKRVNYAARSVITPDPNLNVDEIGLPEAFAMKLTYRVPVTPWNVKELRQMVLNGPDVHPGAVMVEDEKGVISNLRFSDPLLRESVAKRLLTPGEQHTSIGSKKVYRHLVNGDILLLNRQPTLHRPSIMAHKARILKGEKTLRMHYSNCKSYNADFDGDEMNAHFPQSELARSEAYNLVNVCHNFLVPKDGTPLGGLIQDHMVSGVWLSIRGQFFSHEDYSQLVYQAIGDARGNIKLLPPSILKPMQLWSGKQVISTVVINTIPPGRPLINLTSTAKIKGNLWVKEKPRPWRAGGTPFSNDQEMSEAEVVFRGGELLCGVLDKTHYGATPYGLIHCMYELYGGECSSRLLSAFSKLFMVFLQQIQGFTLGVEDILVLKTADEKRTEIMKECRSRGNYAAAGALGLPPDTPADILSQKMEEAYRDPKRNFRGEIDSQYKSLLNPYTDDINKTCLPSGLLQKFPHNNLQLMVQSGAKGSTVNTMQISGLLGQIELEGKRPPLMISGRSLPSFRPYDRQPRAGGFIDGRFMTGIQPQEFFFHCMAGREGLIDTAVKTSRSGYLQRCLIKNLEGLSVQYDGTVRDSDGSIVQFQYGEDGMDISKVQFLNINQMSFLEENHKVVFDKKLSQSLKDDVALEEVSKRKKKIRKWKRTYGNDKTRRSTFLNFTSDMGNEFKLKKLSSLNGRRKGLDQLVELFQEAFDSNEMEKYVVNDKCPDPVFATYPAHSYFGAVTESLEDIISDYLKKRNTSKMVSHDDDDFKDMLYLKSMCSLAPPGEPVGLLAAQSIGEPSTQMTLNTFHFAGRGEMNVTLGIPRLKEILMTASKRMGTPSMEIPFRKDISDLQNIADAMKGKLSKITVADILERVEVTESLILSPVRIHQYVMKMQFLPHKCYRQTHLTDPDTVLQHIENRFLFFLDFYIKKMLSASGKSSSVKNDVKTSRGKAGGPEVTEDNDEEKDLLDIAVKAGTGRKNDGSDEESQDDDDDGDAITAMRHKKQEDTASYSDDSAGETSDSEGDDFIQNEEKNDEEREDKVSRCSFIQNYYFDKKKKEWCVIVIHLPIPCKKINLSLLIQEVAQLSTVSAVTGLKKAFLLNNPRNGLVLKTDGLNIIEMFKYADYLDLNKLYSNDIHAIAGMYGIEAAVRVLVKEIQDVFKVYGIRVDPRHLTLIADFMTFSGAYLPMSRAGLDNHPSSLQKMSFEASIGFLTKSLWLKKTDFLDSPSSRICLGRPCKSGTGAFQLRHQLQTC